MRALVAQGGIGIGISETDDVHADYERLRGEGVEFTSPPHVRPYGTEAIVKDNSSNRFSLTRLRG